MLVVTVDTFIDVCGLWPDDKALAADTGQSVFAVQKWRQRNKIPAHQWQRVVEAAERRGLTQVTLAALAQIAQRVADSRKAAA